MKILLRTLIILAAALVVVGGLYAFAQSPAGQAMRAAGPGGHEGGPPAGFESRRFEGAPGAGFPGGERPGGFDGHEGRGGHGPSLLGLVEVGKNLAIVAVSVILVALGARLLQLGRRDRPRRTPA
jgi:hypothetical protein